MATYVTQPETSVSSCESGRGNIRFGVIGYGYWGPNVARNFNLPGVSQVIAIADKSEKSQKRAAEAKGGIEVGYAIPNGGAQMFFDNFAIPNDAGHVDEAHAFIDYMLRPEVAAKNSNFLGYANGNLASQRLVDKSVLDDRTVYPDAATMAKLYTIAAHDQKTQRVLNRLWTRIKTGH